MHAIVRTPSQNIMDEKYKCGNPATALPPFKSYIKTTNGFLCASDQKPPDSKYIFQQEYLLPLF